MTDRPGHHASCPDCRTCTYCPLPSDVAYCIDETPLQNRPCPHGLELCGEHNLEGCPDCRREAFQDEIRATPDRDPFYTGQTADHLDLPGWFAELDARAAEREAARNYALGRGPKPDGE